MIKKNLNVFLTRKSDGQRDLCVCVCVIPANTGNVAQLWISFEISDTIFKDFILHMRISAYNV